MSRFDSKGTSQQRESAGGLTRSNYASADLSSHDTLIDLGALTASFIITLLQGSPIPAEEGETQHGLHSLFTRD